MNYTLTCELCHKQFEWTSTKKRFCTPCRKRRKKLYADNYRKRPEIKAKLQAYYKEYYQRPEVRERVKEYTKKYNSPEQVEARSKKHATNIYQYALSLGFSKEVARAYAFGTIQKQQEEHDDSA